MRNKNGRQAGKWTCAREAIILNIDTGLRREELFSLRWPQIDLARGVIVTTTSDQKRPRPHGAAARTVPHSSRHNRRAVSMPIMSSSIRQPATAL